MTAPNVLVLDSVRAANTSFLGHSHRTTPLLEELASESTVYRFAYAPSTTSSSSHVSFFTGRHENEHHVYHDDDPVAGVETVWERLRDDGYATGLFTENPQFRKLDSLTRGFETTVLERADSDRLPFPDAADPATFEPADWYPFSDVTYRALACLPRRRPLRTLVNGVVAKRRDPPSMSEYVLDHFEDWRASQDGPWAAFVNLMDAHAPYDPADRHNRWADDALREVQRTVGDGHFDAVLDDLAAGAWWRPSALEHLYDGAIRQADARVRRVVEGLRAAGVFDDTLLVVTSDHGEGFGEPSRLHPGHHVYGHSADVHEVLTHVPLVVSAPGQDRPVSVDDPATLTRLPDAVDAAVEGRFTSETFRGESGRVLVSRGSDRTERARLDDDFPTEASTTLPERMYAHYERDGDHLVKHCLSGDDEATVHVYSAQESIRVAAEADDGRLSQFPGEVGRRGDTAQRPESLDEATRERLERFGYI